MPSGRLWHHQMPNRYTQQTLPIGCTRSGRLDSRAYNSSPTFLPVFCLVAKQLSANKCGRTQFSRSMHLHHKTNKFYTLNWKPKNKYKKTWLPLKTWSMIARAMLSCGSVRYCQSTSVFCSKGTAPETPKKFQTTTYVYLILGNN